MILEAPSALVPPPDSRERDAWECLDLECEIRLLNSLFLQLQLIAEPLEMLYTPGAVIVGLVYTFLPFMILPIYASVEKLDAALIEAALDLGRGRSARSGA